MWHMIGGMVSIKHFSISLWDSPTLFIMKFQQGCAKSFMLGLLATYDNKMTPSINTF